MFLWVLGSSEEEEGRLPRDIVYREELSDYKKGEVEEVIQW